jgi:hypothetical protein
MLATSCGSDGGQTGSLVPDEPCLGRETVAETVTSDVAFGARGDVSDAVLKDSTGQIIVTSLERTQNDDSVLIRAESALTVGEYTLAVSCPTGPEERTLRVAEAEPLPTAVGTLELVATELCEEEVPFVLTLDPSALPYAALMQLELSFDAGMPFVWVRFGVLDPADGPEVNLRLPHCEDAGSRVGCVPRRAGSLSLTAQIAGEVDAVPTLEVPYAGQCQGDEPAACALRSGPFVRSRSQAMLGTSLILAAMVLCARRRAR